MDTQYKYIGHTLVDITRTNITSFSIDCQKHRNQQRNWETVYQIIGLRSQLFGFEYKGTIEDDLSNYSFGVNYSGTHKIWQFGFTLEYANMYQTDQDRYGGLKEDFSIAPIILGLDETAKPPLPLFYVTGPDRNIYFSMDTTK